MTSLPTRAPGSIGRSSGRDSTFKLQAMWAGGRFLYNALVHTWTRTRTPHWTLLAIVSISLSCPVYPALAQPPPNTSLSCCYSPALNETLIRLCVLRAVSRGAHRPPASRNRIHERFYVRESSKDLMVTVPLTRTGCGPHHIYPSSLCVSPIPPYRFCPVGAYSGRHWSNHCESQPGGESRDYETRVHRTKHASSSALRRTASEDRTWASDA